MNTYLKITLCAVLILIACLSIVTPIIEFRSLDIGSVITNPHGWGTAIKHYVSQQLLGVMVFAMCAFGVQLIYKAN
ncbi:MULTISPECIES: hypothetical protein [Vibrio]|jgi:hypothetical protein|uniref:hypothetical protein n=1 Tax=Vibrio TaxID=662 RepID=UPI00056E369C|nr:MULTISPECIES: hypothetical protein [Vibrio]EGQ8650560.1 hypothetical protein [Vibrio cholerae]EGR4421475.1 hypothetical protein [Vibrio cholerae]EII5635341.1 hypothetical protein [Vibrio cholerae]MBY8186483.1 hypothetical protein [Vibrio fluvialis]MCE7650317.1 hypothetical protein [Vibrio fluvialis]